MGECVCRTVVLFAIMAHTALTSMPPPRISPSLLAMISPPEPMDGGQVIESFSVQADIRYRFATTRMESIIRNTAGKAREMGYHVTLPKDAFIIGFAMTINGTVYDGEVKGKQAAREQYDQAVAKGQSAGHIRQAPRHSNRFDVSVNVENGTAVNFTLTYQELLKRKFGFYDYEMHVDPGQAVNDFNVEIFIQENRPLLFVKTPRLRKDKKMTNEVEEIMNDLTMVDRPSETTAHIHYRPTLEQQGTGGITARFAVQYDVEHSDKGDLLVVDGYFLHLFAPKPSTESLPKDILFVLDVSGSMSGTKLAQLKRAMKAILGDLKHEDRFNILSFSSDVHKWKKDLTEVTSQVIAEAYDFVKTMTANGGTNINDALLAALEEVGRREVASRVSMVFFLTDGDATVGVTQTSRIAANIGNKNKETAIFSLAFGDGADFDALKMISTQNDGFARKIYEASDAALQVESLYREISAVAMKDVKVEYLPGVVKTTDTDFPLIFNGTEIVICGPFPIPKDIDRLLEEEKGKHRSPMSSSGPAFRAKILGSEKMGTADIHLDIDDISKVTLTSDDTLNPFFSMPRHYGGIVEKMWAFLTIKQMLRKKQGIVMNEREVQKLEKRILAMSLKYQFVTPLTSMVVTKPQKEVNVIGKETDTKVEMERLDSSLVNFGPKPAGAVFSQMSRSSNRGVSFRRYRGPSGSRRAKIRYLSNLNHRHRSHASPFVTDMPALPIQFWPVIQPTRSTRPIRPTPQPTRPPRPTRRPKSKFRKRKQRKPKVAILSSILLESGLTNTSMCVAPKNWLPGRYKLAAKGGFGVELFTTCFNKACRRVGLKELTLMDRSVFGAVNLTSFDTWAYNQHPDFDVAFGRHNSMIIEHQTIVLTISRKVLRRKVLYSLTLKDKENTTLSGMIDLLSEPPRKPRRGRKARRKVKARRVPRACRNMQANSAIRLVRRKAGKYHHPGPLILSP